MATKARKPAPPVAMEDMGVRQAFGVSVRRSLVQIVAHMPLIAGVMATAAVHQIRATVLPQGRTPWVQVIDMMLLAATGAMACSLVLAPAVRLVTELAELLAVGKNRITHVWRTGRRLPLKTWDTEQADEVEK